MKTMLYCILFGALFLISLSILAQKYERHGNNFVSKVETRSKTNFLKTNFTCNGDTIFCNTSIGRCFVIKTSKKTGNEYRKYLGEELSREVCDALKIKYIETVNKEVKDKSSH